MNRCIFIGNLTRDPELRTTTNGVSVATFAIAVQRKYKGANGEYETDFINCVGWRNTADFVSKYFRKGDKICVCGSMQNRTYTAQNGEKKYITEIIVDEVEFGGKKAVASAKNTQGNGTAIAEGETFLDGIEEEVIYGDLPF